MNCDIIKNIKNINKKSSVQGRILEKFVSQGAFTIPEMSKAVGVSLPTTTCAINELMKAGLVREAGKKDNSAGRIPMVYDLMPAAGYFVGVNPEMDCLALAASDFCGNLITEKVTVPYIYENTPENLERVAEIINEFIAMLPFAKEHTDYCIRNTPYKNGEGDIVGELSKACEKYGLKFGVSSANSSKLPTKFIEFPQQIH